MSAIIFRPPLWSQPSSYSAADDRRLILAALEEGVVDLTDLRVQPRQEGANMSVDVLPGHVVVQGSRQADEGRYLCPLAQRRNVPLAAGPAAGQHRRDLIVATVYEEGTADPAWGVERVTGTPVATSSPPPWPQPGPSAFPLASVGPITTATNAINAGMITDHRKRARPASTGACILTDARFWDTEVTVGNWQTLARIVITTPPYKQPIDVELRLDGLFMAYHPGYWAFAALQVMYYLGSPDATPWAHGGAWTDWEEVGLHSQGQNDYLHVSRGLIKQSQTAQFPQILGAEARIQGRSDLSAGGGNMRANNGFLMLRTTPSAGALWS